MNVYEESVPESRVEMSLFEKTEDVYQTLHHPPVVKNLHPEPGSVMGGRFKTMQMVFNTLIIILLITVLLITVLILIGLRTKSGTDIYIYKYTLCFLLIYKAHYPPFSDEDRELWRLHEGDYYLFWEAEGTCTEALNFCKERDCIIGYVTTENQVYLLHI
ncbi:collagen alpha-1(XVII) chain-like [Astyanax mexicanus]|uniref:Collagen alpha-1(XVII) chain-like n=1 Tax=Astyanax mexicanus TaxID=7994 RepID=A0A8T2MAS3_ASTMX|nr:collagen alpha-1(XVII) chain-like [Astyanax mexicanus]